MKPINIAMMSMTHGHTRKYYQVLKENPKLNWVAVSTANEEVKNEIIENSKDDFLDLCKEAVTDGWVKCEDRLPEEGKQVLVYYEYFRYGDYNRMWPAYGVGYQYDGKWCGDVTGHKLKVIAWQPFPDYEGEMEIEEELPFK